jgi:hypothetical protein
MRRCLLLPAEDGRLLDLGLAGRHEERAGVEVRLERVDRALPEEVRVVVVQRPGEQLDVERAGRRLGDLGAVLVDQAEPREQRRGLLHADVVVVERDVEVDVLGLADEAVVGDDRDALVSRVLQLAGERRAVDRRDDQELRALGDHLVDLLGLGRDVVAGELQLDLVARLRQPGLDGRTVGDPALGRLRRHGDPDEATLRRLAAAVLRAAAGRWLLATGTRAAAAACRERQGEGRAHRECGELPRAHVSSFKGASVMQAVWALQDRPERPDRQVPGRVRKCVGGGATRPARRPVRDGAAASAGPPTLTRR